MNDFEQLLQKNSLTETDSWPFPDSLIALTCLLMRRKQLLDRSDFDDDIRRVMAAQWTSREMENAELNLINQVLKPYVLDEIRAIITYLASQTGLKINV